MELIVATANRKKLREIRSIWRGLGFKLTSLADYPGSPKIVENGRTFKENAVKKAVAIARWSGKLTMGEDSGLCVDALGGAPGVRSARFAGSAKDDGRNNAKLLRLLEGMPAARRGAQYVSAIALATPQGVVGVVEGTCRGRIGTKPKGSTGFGYDPLFVVPRLGRTFAQLGPRIKHTMSHRRRALVKARRVLERYQQRGVAQLG